MINKELLSEVLGKDAKFHKYIEDRSVVLYIQDIADCREINIYELAHKCKEWALSKGYDTRSGFNSYLKCYFCDIYKDLIHQARYEYTTARTSEPEAIFKACEWIMEQTKCGS